MGGEVVVAGGAGDVARVRAEVDALFARLARRPHFPVRDPDAVDCALGLDWSRRTFPAYGQMCDDLGLPLFPGPEESRRRWWREAAP